MLELRVAVAARAATAHQHSEGRGAVVTGPLDGVRVVELASIGPIPFCGLVLSDMGADVVRVDKPVDVATADPSRAPGTVLDRGRRSIGVDLKSPRGVEVVLRLVDSADVLIEGYRPGVAERLGIGPDDCLGRNPRLVYGRLTGWGRQGPLADRAGHDIDYIALAGALSAFGRSGGPPTPPLNIVGDFGGGGLLLAYGVACALVSTARTGNGQVVDTAMVDGTALLMAPFYAARQIGFWSDERGTNMLDTGSPYYDTYECADGKYVAVGAIEPQFYAALLDGLELSASDLPDRDDRTQVERVAGRVRGSLQVTYPRRVGRPLRWTRRVRRARPRLGRGAEASAQRRQPHVRRGRRRHPSRAGPAVRHDSRVHRPQAVLRRRAHGRGAGRARLRRRRDRTATSRRRRRLARSSRPARLPSAPRSRTARRSWRCRFPRTSRACRAAGSRRASDPDPRP